MKIFVRSQKDIKKRSTKDYNRKTYKDLKKILGRNCLRIFLKKIRSFEDFIKIFS